MKNKADSPKSRAFKMTNVQTDRFSKWQNFKKTYSQTDELTNIWTDNLSNRQIFNHANFQINKLWNKQMLKWTNNKPHNLSNS